MHFERAVFETDLHRGLIWNILQPDLFQAITNGGFTHVILANDPQSHVETMARDVIDEVQSFRILRQAFPVDVIRDRHTANFLNLFHAAWKSHFLQFFNLPSLVQSHDVPPVFGSKSSHGNSRRVAHYVTGATTR